MANRFDTLIDAWEPPLRRAFLDAVYQLRDFAQIDQIARMLEAGDVDGALRAVGLDPVAFRKFDRTLEDAFESGGKATAQLVPVTADAQGLRTVFQFNIRNPQAENWLRIHSAGAVKDILDDQRAMIRAYLSDAMAKGVNPRTAALDLVGRISATTGKREGGTIGLTASQEQWVRKYAEELASQNPLAALERTLRDKRFDATVLKAARDKTPIPADLVQKMLRNYRNNALRYRAEAIARTEAMAALHQSQEEAMRQAVESGAIAAQTVAYVWRTAGDARVRDSHAAMEGQRRKMGDMFTTGNGARLRYPGDPEGPASEIVNCRCWRETSVDFLAEAA